MREDMITTDRELTPELVTYHNTYAMGKGAFDAAVRIVTTGGEALVTEDKVQVSGAKEVLMLMRIVPWKTPMPRERSEAWAYSPEHPDFSVRIGQFDPVPPLADSSVVPYLEDADSVALMPQLVSSVVNVQGGYAQLFAPHAKQHAALFDRVSLDLGGGEDRTRPSAELIAEAGTTGRLSPALTEKIYDAGRYMFICCAGELPPNLLRIHSDGEVSSHGRAHMGLSAAHLGMAEEAFGRIQVLVTGGSMYDSLMCSHEPNGRIFNLDANGAIPEITNRMLVRSHPGSLALLPALPQAWPRGEIRGIRARQQIAINRLVWDALAKRITLEMTSGRDQTIRLELPVAESIGAIKVTARAARIEEIQGKRAARRVRVEEGVLATLEIGW